MNKINILFLDDDRIRIAEAQKLYLNNERVDVLTICKTAENAIEMLQSGLHYHLVHLDHDLGGETYVDSNRKDCGFEVARWIVKNNPKNIDVISIHSWNVNASRSMMGLLNNFKSISGAHYSIVFYIPFAHSGWDIGNNDDLFKFLD